MNTAEEITRGGRFAEYAEVFAEVMDGMRDSIGRQMDCVPMTQTEMHSKLILTRQLLNSIDKYVQTVIDTGKMAEFQLAQEEKKRNFRLFGS